MSESEKSKDNSLKLSVLEVTQSPAAAFAAALLGDFGASVTVLECAGGSRIRSLGGDKVRQVWWPILARNKRSVAVDFSLAESLKLIDSLVSQVDVIFVDDSDIGTVVFDSALRCRSNALVTRVFHPGSDRPFDWIGSTSAEYAGLATGVVGLTGYSNQPPIQAEFPLADSTSGMMAATLALFELRRARIAGESPQNIEIGAHETLQRMNEWQVIAASVQGAAEPRNGNRFPMNWNVGNIFITRDKKLLTVSAATPSVADRLMRMVGGETLSKDPRFSTPQARRENMDALDKAIGDWIQARDADDVMRQVAANDVVVGPLYDAQDLLNDAHIKARGDIVWMKDSRGKDFPMPAPLPHIESMPGSVNSLGPLPGEGQDEVLMQFGFKREQIHKFKDSGVLWT